MKSLVFIMSLYQPLDKKAHILAGYGISATAYAITYKYTGQPNKSALIGFGSAVVIGVVKEVGYDYLLHRGDPTVKDALSTSIGGALGALTFRIIINKKKNETFNNRHYNRAIYY